MPSQRMCQLWCVNCTFSGSLGSAIPALEDAHRNLIEG